MEKLFIAVLLSNLTFPLFTLQAQDTLVLKNGEKMVVKVVSVDEKINYLLPPDNKQMSVRLSKVRRIKYEDGTRFTNNDDGSKFTNNRDTARKKWKPYILVSGGVSMPWAFSGYGATGFYSSYDGYGYSGYANNGSDFSLTYGLKNHRGFEFTGMFSYIRNEFDASGVMTETIANFLGGNGFILPSQNGNNVSAIGTYYYKNYSILAGISKSWGTKNVSAGFSIMLGDFITVEPAMQGIATNNPAYNGQTSPSYYFNMNSETENNSDFVVSLHIDASITKHFFLRLLAEFQLSGLTNGGSYQIVDAATGSILNSGSYPSNNLPSWVNSNLFVGLTDLTAGIGYKF